MAKTQQKAMEIKRRESKIVTKKRRVILDIATLLEKGIKTLDPEIFMWTHTKKNYDKHVEQMENWKDIVEKRLGFKSKACYVVFNGLGSIDAQCHVGISEHILDQGHKYLLAHKDKVYAISKQFIKDVFGICVEGYVEESKRQVSKSLVIQTLQSCRLALANFSTDQWNTKNLGLPYFF